MVDVSEAVSEAARTQARRKQMFEMITGGWLSIVHADKKISNRPSMKRQGRDRTYGGRTW